MPTVADQVSVAANDVSTNQMEGKLYRFVPRGTIVKLYATGSATGLRVTLTNGVPVIDDSRINNNNRPPQHPDDFLTEFRAPGGEIFLKFRNTTAGALTAFWRLDIGVLAAIVAGVGAWI